MTSIKVGMNGGTAKIYAGVTLVGIGRGYFKRQGLDIEVLETGGRRDSIPMLASDELDVTAQGPNLEFFQAWKPNGSIVMVADHGAAKPGRGGAGGIVARPELVTSGQLRDFSDLRGKRVALSPRKYDHDWFTICSALELGGLTVDDIQVVTIGMGGGRHEALADGSIDVTTVDRPASIKEGAETGAFVVWKHEYEVRPGRQQRAVVFGHRFRTERPDEAQRYIVAYLQGLRDYYDAFENGVNRDTIIDVLSAECGDPRAVVEATIPAGVNPDGYLNVDAIEHDLRWYQDGGFLSDSVPLDGLIDHSYIEAAIAELGPYRAPEVR
ncbi:MAG: transporter, substrate-binding protein, aliphatic sulfonates family [Chloroflexi bacterium]|nr:transporter, substrate-binding protein, aliphatic sulfonates family [Chloroflexota bacterium]